MTVNFDRMDDAPVSRIDDSSRHPYRPADLLDPTSHDPAGFGRIRHDLYGSQLCDTPRHSVGQSSSQWCLVTRLIQPRELEDGHRVPSVGHLGLTRCRHS